jgi:prepilin-type N-terminal cleavage/methylation domain-containing protein
MNRRSALRGFTLVELIVAVGLLAIVLLLLASMTNSTASIWRLTSGKIEEFRSAGNAFDALTRRLSQATLNTYWDYDSPTAPTTYLRHSELRFLSGPATANSYGSGVFPSNVVTSGTTTTHAIFFQAPLGFVDESPLIDNPNFGGLDNLVNTWGYYVEYNADVRPNFINSLAHPPPARNRYRLMELMQPSNQMTIYNYTSGYNVSGTTPRSLTYVTNPPLAGLSLPTLPSGLTPTSTPGGRARMVYRRAERGASPGARAGGKCDCADIVAPAFAGGRDAAHCKRDERRGWTSWHKPGSKLLL